VCALALIGEVCFHGQPNRMFVWLDTKDIVWKFNRLACLIALDIENFDLHFIPWFRFAGGKLEKSASHYEGPTGIAGVLGDRLSAEGIEFSTLWAGLPHYIGVSPNPRGALALLERLTTLIGLRLDLEPLRSEAARFEGKVSALVAEDPELGEYVRQLKRRDFAQ
jgi:hypothetical protein